VELLIFFVVALGAIGFLATRFGYDSRDSAWSKEAEIGAHGVTWEPGGGLPTHLHRPEIHDTRGTDSSAPSRLEFEARSGELVGSVRW